MIVMNAFRRGLCLWMFSRADSMAVTVRDYAILKAMAAQLQHWDPAWGPLNEENLRRHLESEGYRVSKYRYEPGTFFSEHTHAIHKKDDVLVGHLRISTHEGEVVLGP